MNSVRVKMKNHNEKAPRKMKQEDRRDHKHKPDYSEARRQKREFS